MSRAVRSSSVLVRLTGGLRVRNERRLLSYVADVGVDALRAVIGDRSKYQPTEGRRRECQLAARVGLTWELHAEPDDRSVRRGSHLDAVTELAREQQSPTPDMGLIRGAVADHRILHPIAGVADLADDLVGRGPDAHLGALARVTDGVGRHLARGHLEVADPVGMQPGRGCLGNDE